MSMGKNKKMLYDPNKTKKWTCVINMTSRTLIKQPKENMKKKTLAYMHKLKTTQKQKKKSE